MNESTMMIIGVTLAGVVVFGFGTTILKKKRMTKLVSLIQTGKLDEFMVLIDSKSTRFLFPGYNVEYLKLNAVIIEGNKRKINDQFDKMLEYRLGKKQDEDLTMKAFNYYLGLEDKHRTKNLLERMQKFNNVRLKEEAQIMYDIFIAKESKYIEQMLEQLKDQNEEQASITEYLLSIQYANAKDKVKAKEYEELYKKHTEMAQKKYEQQHQAK